MKIASYIVILFLLIGLSVQAQQDTIPSTQNVEYRFALGVQLGTDIGGAIPFPFSNVPSPFNPYPQLYPSLGAKLSFPITNRWGIGAEVSYKKVSIDADARIENQRFNDEKTTSSPGLQDLPKWE